MVALRRAQCSVTRLGTGFVVPQNVAKDVCQVLGSYGVQNPAGTVFLDGTRHFLHRRNHLRQTGVEGVEQFVGQTPPVVGVGGLVQTQAHPRATGEFAKLRSRDAVVKKDAVFQSVRCYQGVQLRQNVSTPHNPKLGFGELAHRQNRFLSAAIHVDSRSLEQDHRRIRLTKIPFFGQIGLIRADVGPMERNVAHHRERNAVLFKIGARNGRTYGHGLRHEGHAKSFHRQPNCAHGRPLSQFWNAAKVFVAVVKKGFLSQKRHNAHGQQGV